MIEIRTDGPYTRLVIQNGDHEVSIVFKSMGDFTYRFVPDEMRVYQKGDERDSNVTDTVFPAGSPAMIYEGGGGSVKADPETLLSALDFIVNGH